MEISKWYFAGLGGALQMTLYQNAELHFYTAIVVTLGQLGSGWGLKEREEKQRRKCGTRIGYSLRLIIL